MHRIAIIATLALLVLASCDEAERRQAITPGPPRAAKPVGGAHTEEVAVTASMRESGPKLAYSHELVLEMDSASVAPRFEKARNACLEDAALGCSLVRASIYVGDPKTGQPPEAALSVRLPHDKIVAFESVLIARLPGEGEGEPLLRRRSTEAEDLTYAIADIERRLAQATDYRERLVALSKQGSAKIADLIQIEEKLSEVQSEIEEMTAERRGMAIRVDTELLDIALNAKPSFSVASSPLAEAWRDAGRALGESAAAAFTFLVIAMPWLPLVALAAYLVTRLWRLVRRRRATTQAAATRAQPAALTSPEGS
jgi:hypothetical protein